MSLLRYIFIGAPGVGKGTFSKILCERNNWAHISLGDILRSEISKKSELGLEVKSKMDQGLLINDELATSVVISKIKNIENDKLHTGFLLDGFPRTLNQAKLLDQLMKENKENSSKKDTNLVVINIELDERVMRFKLHGRRACGTCGASLNHAHVVEDSFDMPAILPSPSTCGIVKKEIKELEKNQIPISEEIKQIVFDKVCNPVLLSRDDDTEEAITARLEEHNKHFQPILDYYNIDNRLLNFQVHKGVKDVDQLYDQMVKKFNEIN